MKNDMKLIMESWRSNVLLENLPDCPTNTVKVRELVAGTVYTAMTDEEKEEFRKLAGGDLSSILGQAQNAGERAEIEKASESKLWVKVAKIGLLFSSFITAIGIAIPTLPIVGAGALGIGMVGAAGGATAAGYGAAAAAAIPAIAEVLGGVLASKNEEKLVGSDAIQKYLKLFCIDITLLRMLEDSLQNNFVKESGLMAEIETFLNGDQEAELPDLNKTLLNWLNSKNPDRTEFTPKP
jgi:hypothetical protein